MASLWDVFICHASEDKDRFVRPFAEALRRVGANVWFDEFSLSVGDSLSREIDRGIAGASFGVVVVSHAFLSKPWVKHELGGLVNRGVEEDFRILPIWFGVTKADVRHFSPSLSDKLAIDMRKDNVSEAALKVLRIVRPDLYQAQPRGRLERLVSGDVVDDLQNEIEALRDQLLDYQCPYCQSELVERNYIEYDEKNSGEVETFACGFSRGGWQMRPCPADPRFPKLTDYCLEIVQDDDRLALFSCHAKPRTDMARAVPLPVGSGRTMEEARRIVVEQYRQLSTT